MDFDLTEDQREIKGVARELLAARSPMARVREAAEGGGIRHRRCATRSSGSAGRGSPSPRSTAGRAWARWSWRCCSRSSATPARRRRSCPPPWPRR